MRFSILIFFIFIVGACSKNVETVYFEEKDITRFSAKPFKVPFRTKEIELAAVKECPGKVICVGQEIKFKIKHEDRFTYLKGKDLILETDNGEIDLNERDYSNIYDIDKIAKDGTSGVMKEQFLIWLSESDFSNMAYSKTAIMKIGKDSYFLPIEEGRDYWQTMLDRKRLLEIMDDEQKREYGKYPRERKKLKEISVQEKRMAAEAEESTWNLIKDSKNVEDLKYFLEKFPDSPYTIPAKLKLKQLER
tara:strand:- start:11288 stop:12031 length:744 start_codon:yes stop_codon:yes gene_type:complete